MKMLEFLCKKNNVSYTAIANELDISPQTVSKWGKGIKPIPRKYYEQLASMLQVNVEEIDRDINVEGNPITSTEEQWIIESIVNNDFKIALQPCADDVAKENYRKTIEYALPISVLENMVTNQEYEKIREIYSTGLFNVWGVRDGVKENSTATLKQYEKLSVGDLVLFYRNREFVSMGLVTFKITNKKLSKLFWGTDEFKNIYFLDSIFPCNISVNDVNKVYYGKDTNDAVQGFKVLTAEGSQKLAKALEFSDLIETSSFKGFKSHLKDKLDKLKQLGQNEDLNVTSDSYSRAEQALLRNYMLGERSYHHCSLCGELFHSSEIVTAHVKKRAYASLDERLDPHIVMPACKFGCDHLYEFGFVFVDEEGVIRSNDLLEKRVTPFVKKRINDIAGRTCSNWGKDTTSQYFKWHREFHLKKM